MDERFEFLFVRFLVPFENLVAKSTCGETSKNTEVSTKYAQKNSTTRRKSYSKSAFAMKARPYSISTHKNPSNKNDAIAFISDNCVYWQVAHYCTSEQFKIK